MMQSNKKGITLKKRIDTMRKTSYNTPNLNTEAGLKKNEVMQVDLKDLVTRENCRGVLDQDALAELMTSMKQEGLLSPIGIKEDEKSDKWEIVYGNRRAQAARKLGWKTIGCVFVDCAVDKTSTIIANLSENVIRENPSLVELGVAYDRLRKEAGLTIAQVAARMGVSVQKVKYALDANSRIPEEHRHKISNLKLGGKKKAGHISAHTALEIESAKKSGLINATQARVLYDSAASGASRNQIHAKIRTRSLGDYAKLGDSVTVSIKVLIHKESLRKYSFKSKKAFTDEAKNILKSRYSDLLI